MKKFIFSIFLLLTIAKTQAQYVNIPDSNFRNFLIAKYPACFNASKQMDTTCGAVVNEDSLSFDNKNVVSVEGIKYFKSLSYFNCSFNKIINLPLLPDNLISVNFNGNELTSLPVLPINLKYLYSDYNQLTVLPALPNSLIGVVCYNNQLTSLPALPNSLISVSCDNNQLTSLPALPNSLKFLGCGSNHLTSLPVLPDSLKFLNCAKNQLISLPTLPTNLYELYCSYNQLTSLPTLYNSLVYLYCNHNQITSLPTLPSNLTYLYCDHNKLTSLPVLPIILNKFDCSFNQLTGLPALPNSLQDFVCDNNQLTSLPALPKVLYNLSCINNDIYCLPKLPKSLINFLFDFSKIKCFPNPFINLNYPLCNPLNNINGCPSLSFAYIEGKVFYDANSNGLKDSAEVYSNNIKVDFGGIETVITNSNGYYNFTIDSLASYTITPATPIANAAFNPPFANVILNKIDTVVAQNFAIQPTTVKDSLEVVLSINNRTRAGGVVWFQVAIKNVGSTNLNNVSSVLYLDSSKVGFGGLQPYTYTNTSNSISVNIPNIPFGGYYKYYGWFTTKTTVAIGDTIATNATATNGILLVTNSANTLVRGSFDPNDKQATPELYTTEVAQGKKIDYTIRFQNTGNDTAFHVVIADTLDSKLDFGSLQIIATSHNCKTTIKDNIIFFEMRNIMLPDSNVNYLASNGFIRFTMQPKNNVVAGDNIPNKAAIYFDYNAPVITNTAVTQIKNPLLPVTFMSYILKQAQDNKNEIENTWTTANEVNLSHYIVQRSDDGRVFKSVGKVDAVGVSSYSFIDNKMSIINNTKTFYYRVIAVDKNGNYQFTEVRQITINEKQPTILIYPNPAKDIVNIGVDAATTATIVNAQGQTVKSVLLQKGSNNINIASLPNGVYYLKTENNYERLLITK